MYVPSFWRDLGELIVLPHTSIEDLLIGRANLVTIQHYASSTTKMSCGS